MKLITKLIKPTLFYKSIVALAVLTTCLGAASVTNVKSQKNPITTAVIQSFDRIKSAYETADLQNLYAELDPNFEGIQSFQSTIENYLLTHQQIQIDFTIDSILNDANNVSTQFHWTKKFIDPSGAVVKQNGNGQFGFIITDTTAKLTYIRGDNPLW